MANFLSTLFSSGASNLVEAVGDAIDKTFTSDEERKELDNELAKARIQYETQLATLSLDEKKAVLGDIDSARNNQSRVQESANASWLAKNVQPFLALVIIGLTFAMFWWVIFSGAEVLSKDDSMKDIIIYILGALTTVATQVAAYFFGSSQGSAEKHKEIARLTGKDRQ